LSRRLGRRTAGECNLEALPLARCFAVTNESTARLRREIGSVGGFEIHQSTTDILHLELLPRANCTTVSLNGAIRLGRHIFSEIALERNNIAVTRRIPLFPWANRNSIGIDSLLVAFGHDIFSKITLDADDLRVGCCAEK